MSKPKKYRRPMNPRKAERLAEQVLAAQERDARLRKIVATLPPPPPDPQRFTAPEEVAAFRKAWDAWHASLTPEQTEALRVAHNRELFSRALKMGGKVIGYSDGSKT